MNRELLLKLQESLIEGLSGVRTVVRSGNYVSLLSEDDPMVWMNQSMPMGPVSDADLDALLVTYEQWDRQPFFEFSPDLWPGVEGLLQTRGLACHNRMPVMVVSGWNSAETPARPIQDGEYAEFRSVAGIAFGSPAGADPSGADRLRDQVTRGATLASVALMEDRIVSVGQAIGTKAVREVAGLGTLPDFRRQGHCTAVIQSLLNQHFEAGGELAWLTPGDDGAEVVYAKVGFETIGSQVAYGLP